MRSQVKLVLKNVNLYVRERKNLKLYLKLVWKYEKLVDQNESYKQKLLACMFQTQ